MKNIINFKYNFKTMKKISITLFLSMLFISLFSQENGFDNLVAYKPKMKNTEPTTSRESNFWYEIRGAYKRPVLKETLNSARTLDEISPGYPTNWLSDYISTEISSVCKGVAKKASGNNEILTDKQKELLSTTDNGDEILIRVKYKTPNAAIDKMDIHTMSYSVTLVPEHEAEYKGGVVQMKKYLKENVINKIAEPETGQQLEGVVRFTVNEEGEIIDPKIKVTTNNPKSDKLLLDAIRNMPKWKPATNSKGGKMKQDFEFAMGTGGC